MPSRRRTKQCLKHELRCQSIVIWSSLGALFYFLAERWDDFEDCEQPLHHWAFLQLVLFMVLKILFSLLNQCPLYFHSLFHFLMMAYFPILIVWAGVGTWWQEDVAELSPECIEGKGVSWIPIFVVSLAYILCGIYLAILALLLYQTWRVGEYREEEFAAPLLEPGGLNETEMSQIEVRVLNSGDSQTRVDDSIHTLCTICYMGYRKGEAIRTMPGCGHAFHQKCIDGWLAIKTTCPNCNTDTREAMGEETKEEEEKNE